MKAADTCRRLGMLARLSGDAEENHGDRCLESPTHRVLVRDDATPGLLVDVLADVCGGHFQEVQRSAAFVTFWPLRPPAST